MIRFALAFGAIALLMSMTGCKRGRGDSLTEKRIALHNELAEAIEKKDAMQYQRVADEYKDVVIRLRQLNLSGEELQKLTEKYKGDWEKADARFRAAAEKEHEFMEKMDSSSAK